MPKLYASPDQLLITFRLSLWNRNYQLVYFIDTFVLGSINLAIEYDLFGARCVKFFSSEMTDQIISSTKIADFSIILCLQTWFTSLKYPQVYKHQLYYPWCLVSHFLSFSNPPLDSTQKLYNGLDAFVRLLTLNVPIVYTKYEKLKVVKF